MATASLEVLAHNNIDLAQQRVVARRIAELTGGSLLEATLDVAIASAVVSKEHPSEVESFEGLRAVWYGTKYEVAANIATTHQTVPPVRSLAQFAALMPYSGIPKSQQDDLLQAYTERCDEPTAIEYYDMGKQFNLFAALLESSHPGVHLGRDF